MPALARLELKHLRNILSAEIEPGAGFNLFFGDNGSGKTSVLEGLYLLAMGRSFRSHLQKSLVTEGESEATVFGQTTDGLSLGISRPLRGAQTLRVGGRKAEGLAELSQSLPLQLINAETFQILEGSPSERRRFLDWGVFHVEHRFLDSWRRARVALQNRNSLLRSEASAAEIEPWTLELVKSAELMDQQRRAYMDNFRALVDTQLSQTLAWSTETPLQMEYYPGWREDTELYRQLEEDLGRDRKLGHTSWGPHRADLKFRFGRTDAAELLSRGQLKLLICLLKIAQAQLLEQQRHMRCIFAIDDLPAELDASNRRKICGQLATLNSQVFLTSIEREALERELISAVALSVPSKLFHVKHGKIAAL
ncbi:MAG TPA: DNA replication/repair protein RecF [Pseudomonadales bacterium]